MPGITITESRPNDVLAALHSSAEAEREYLFAAREAQPDDLILVAWKDGDAVGYIATSDERDQGLLVWEHVVVPAHRGQGIGQRLLVEAARRTLPGAIIVIDPMAELDAERVSDYYSRLGFARPADGGLWATATDVIRATRKRQAAQGETATPVSVIVNGKPPGVVTIAPDKPVREAVATMSNERVGAIVVSRDGSRVEGILSERDVLVSLDQLGAELLDKPVADVCTTDVVTATAYDSVADVMELMTNQRIRHLPVTSTGRLIGIVSVGDLVLHRLYLLEGTPPPANAG
jgi:CBS domain-containing protein/GNAT superfamily N-acetyltransferase